MQTMLNLDPYVRGDTSRLDKLLPTMEETWWKYPFLTLFKKV